VTNTSQDWHRNRPAAGSLLPPWHRACNQSLLALRASRDAQPASVITPLLLFARHLLLQCFRPVAWPVDHAIHAGALHTTLGVASPVPVNPIVKSAAVTPRAWLGYHGAPTVGVRAQVDRYIKGIHCKPPRHHPRGLQRSMYYTTSPTRCRTRVSRSPPDPPITCGIGRAALDCIAQGRETQAVSGWKQVMHPREQTRQQGKIKLQVTPCLAFLPMP